jgi:hydroxymethylpyrimidine/phosphomethylpyrimidine kinase
MTIKRVLTIAGSDSGGGAGIQADIKTITALGGFAMSVITALTAQNTLGVHGIHEVPPDFIARQFDAVCSDIGVDAAKTGMLASSEILSLVAKKITEHGISNLVVDPVMVAKGGAPLLSEDARMTMIHELVPLALVITPNIPEAEVLAGIPIDTIEAMKEAAVIIHRLGAANVVVKGGHLPGDAVDVLFDGKGFYHLETRRIPTGDTHGTGCTFSAAIAAGIARGMPVPDAVRMAKDFITTAVRFSLRLGSGHGPTNHCATIIRESERVTCIEALSDAFSMLASARCGGVIPESGSNLGYALSYSYRESDVAAFRGRLVRSGDGVEALHDPSFGASKRVARAILMMMGYSPEHRSAMNIRSAAPVIDACSRLGFKTADIQPDEPFALGSSVEQSIASVMDMRQSFPDVIYDYGANGLEPMALVFGCNPREVVEKAIAISNSLRES